MLNQTSADHSSAYIGWNIFLKKSMGSDEYGSVE